MTYLSPTPIKKVGDRLVTVGDKGHMQLIGIDPGISNCGIAVVEIISAPLSIRPLFLGVTSTKKSAAKRNIRAADDTCDRVRQIARAILDQIDPGQTLAICVESQVTTMHMTSKRTAAILGRIRGVLDGIAETYRLPILEETPQELKRIVTGSRTASKEQMILELDAQFGSGKMARGLVSLFGPLKQNKREHAADALAACLAGFRSTQVQTAIRFRSGLNPERSDDGTRQLGSDFLDLTVRRPPLLASETPAEPG